MVNVVEPKVEFIAGTEINFDPIDSVMEVDFDSSPSETLMTFAGRNCYQSFHRPRPETAKDADYLERTLFEQGHWSIAEHATATFYITGVSRAFLTELTRHRHLSFSVLSQRFVDESDLNIVIPPALRARGFVDKPLLELGEGITAIYRTIADELQLGGLSRKQAREAARAVLPNMAETRIVVTGNLRTWHEVIERRTQPDVDAEMREVMLMVEDKLADVSPVLFGKNAMITREKKAARAERKERETVNIPAFDGVVALDALKTIVEALGGTIERKKQSAKSDSVQPRRSPRSFGKIAEKNGRFYADYPGPDGASHTPGKSFALRADAEFWLNHERSLIDSGAWTAPATRGYNRGERQ